MSQNDILNFLNANSSNRCGIFYPNQLQISEVPIKKVRFPGFWSLSFLALLGFSFPSTAQPRTNPQLEQFPKGYSKNSPSDTTQITQRKIKGKVIDEIDKEGLPGVSILIKGEKIGTSTNLDGEFELEIPESIQSEKITLLLSFLGYQIKEVSIYQSQLPTQLGKIILSNDEKALMGEVIITKKPNIWRKIKGVFNSEQSQNCLNPNHKHA